MCVPSAVFGRLAEDWRHVAPVAASPSPVVCVLASPRLRLRSQFSFQLEFLHSVKAQCRRTLHGIARTTRVRTIISRKVRLPPAPLACTGGRSFTRHKHRPQSPSGSKAPSTRTSTLSSTLTSTLTSTPTFGTAASGSATRGRTASARGEAERESEQNLERDSERDSDQDLDQDLERDSESEQELEWEQQERGGEFRGHVAASHRGHQAIRWTRGGSRARSAG